MASGQCLVSRVTNKMRWPDIRMKHTIIRGEQPRHLNVCWCHLMRTPSSTAWEPSARCGRYNIFMYLDIKYFLNFHLSFHTCVLIMSNDVICNVDVLNVSIISHCIPDSLSLFFTPEHNQPRLKVRSWSRISEIKKSITRACRLPWHGGGTCELLCCFTANMITLIRG